MNGNQIKGFVKYNEIEYGFFFADEELLLFPCNEEQRQKDTPNLFDMLLSGRPQPRKVIKKILISGTTSDGKNVTFQVSEDPGNDNGYLYFQVYAIYLYTKHHHVYAKDLSTQSSVANCIRGFRIGGQDVDFFYNPSYAFEYKISRDSRFQNSVSVSDIKPMDCGVLAYDGVDISVLVCACPAMHFQLNTPYTCSSELIFQFSKEVQIEFVQEFIGYLQLCMRFICRRRDVVLGDAQIFDIDESEKSRSFGELCIFQFARKPSEDKKTQNVITYQMLGENFAKLLQCFCDKVMYTNHYPVNTASYSPDRIIFLLIGFEREFQNLNPEDSYRCEEYLKVKSKIKQYADELAETSPSKEAKYAKSFSDSIDKMQIGFGNKLRRAIVEHQSIMDCFLIDEYGEKYKEQLNEICTRMNRLRNDLAHGNLDLKLCPEHIGDLKMVEQLLYAMRLKAIGVEERSVRSAINTIFRCNLSLDD